MPNTSPHKNQNTSKQYTKPTLLGCRRRKSGVTLIYLKRRWFFSGKKKLTVTKTKGEKMALASNCSVKLKLMPNTSPHKNQNTSKQYTKPTLLGCRRRKSGVTLIYLKRRWFFSGKKKLTVTKTKGEKMAFSRMTVRRL